MSEPCLVIFIDAYPFWALDGSRLRERLPIVRAVRPGFGYSINCQVELFTGKRPDEIGYWCEFSYQPDKAIVNNGALKTLDLFRRWRIPNRACHRIVDKALGKPTKDIPFAYLHYFSKSGKDLFSRDFPADSILKRDNVYAFSYLDFPGLPNPESRDRCIFEAASRAIQGSPMRAIVAAFGDFDHAGHWHRPGSDPYWAVRDTSESQAIGLMDLFERAHPNGTIIVISDHGMSPVEKCVNLNIERRFGKPKPQRYIYFLEGTILRVWTTDDILKNEIQHFVGEFNDVEILTTEERARLGVKNPSFGDIIAVTDDGTMWLPTFWGARPSKGMHGYHPRYERQLGIFLSNRAIDNAPGTLDAAEVAGILNNMVPGN
jgi:hypothetical protein